MIDTATITVQAHRKGVGSVKDENGNELYRRLRLVYEGEWKVNLQILEDTCKGDDTLSTVVVEDVGLHAPKFDELCVDYLRMRGYNIQKEKTDNA